MKPCTYNRKLLFADGVRSTPVVVEGDSIVELVQELECSHVPGIP